MKDKIICFIFLFSFLFICAKFADASTIELKNYENKIIINITENNFLLAAGKVIMEIPSVWNLSAPEGAGFFSNIYAVKRNASKTEFQFFELVANNSLGELEIPFYAPAGAYSVKIVKIGLYNKSDFLIPFSYPLEIQVVIGNLAVIGSNEGYRGDGRSENQDSEGTAIINKSQINLNYSPNILQQINQTTDIKDKEEEKTLTAESFEKKNPGLWLIAVILAAALGVFIYRLLQKNKP